MEADKSYFVLNPATDWQPVEIVERWAVTVNFIKENLRRATKDSITLSKLRENKRENESFGSFKRKLFSPKGFDSGYFHTGRKQAGGQELVCNGSEQRNNLVRTPKH